MNVNQIADITQELIAIESVTGNEYNAIAYLKGLFDNLGWEPIILKVNNGRCNIFARFGTPEIIFTTHIDVVPAPEKLFVPAFIDNKIYGRGACDAKGIAATMIGVADRLLAEGKTNFGLLFVVGEEEDGCGAKQAAIDLKERGIKYVVNGEPTSCKLILAHRGVIEGELNLAGRACHSGYPQLGEDANLKLINAVNAINNLDLGTDKLLGKATINYGVIQGGVASNVVSPNAYLRFCIRSVSDSKLIIASVQEALRSCTIKESEINFIHSTEPAFMLKLDNFETGIVPYVTDIPNLAPLNAKFILYGPGSPLDAHTDQENISLEEIEKSYNGYLRIFYDLSNNDYLN